MEWKTSQKLVDYPEAVEAMETRVEDILAGRKPHLGWLLEHPPLYTAGTSAKEHDLLKNAPFPTYKTGRGGEWTYHGPGQRICYLMLDLKKYDLMDMRAYVHKLEEWIIATLAEFGVEGFTREGRVGVWVSVPPASGRTENLPPLVGEERTAPPASGGGKGGVPYNEWQLGAGPYSTRQSEAQTNAKELRHNLTKAERKLWYEALTAKQLENFKFRKQMPIGPYIADFACMEKKLIIELDGGQHGESEGEAHDKKRTAFLEEAGYRVLRFWNNDVLKNLEGVAETIRLALLDTHPPLNPPPLAGGAKEAKIAALGVRVRKWVTYHGISLNVSPDLSHYAGIVPCGIKEHGVTSLAALGIKVGIDEVDKTLQEKFAEIFH